MHKAVTGLTGLAVACEEAVLLVDFAAVVIKGCPKIPGIVIVMMQVDFDFAEAVPAKIGKTGQFTLAIHFQGIKKRVPGRVPVAVAKAGEKTRVGFDPAVDPFIRELRAAPPAPGSK